MTARVLIFALLAPALAAATPAPSMLPSGELLALSDGASYAVAPDGAVIAQSGLLSFFPEGARPLWPRIQAPAWVVQGRMLTVLVAAAAPLDEIVAVVRRDTGEEVSRGRGFELPVDALEREQALLTVDPGPSTAVAPGPQVGPWVEGERVRVFALLVAFPSEAQPGTCELWIRGREGARSFESVSRLDVFPGEYTEARVALSSTLTTLRTRTDARAREDQRRLDRAVTTFTASSVFHLDPVRAPVVLSPLSAGYGDRRVYLYSDGKTARTTHRGLDVALPAGTRVSSCARGRVILAGELLTTGRTVAVEHLPGVTSFYFHLDAIDVKEGDLVEPGQPIGRVGSTGLATGAHLHWEIRSGGLAFDPQQALDHALVDKAAVFGIIASYRSQQQRR